MTALGVAAAGPEAAAPGPQTAPSSERHPRLLRFIHWKRSLVALQVRSARGKSSREASRGGVLEMKKGRARGPWGSAGFVVEGTVARARITLRSEAEPSSPAWASLSSGYQVPTRRLIRNSSVIPSEVLWIKNWRPRDRIVKMKESTINLQSNSGLHMNSEF